MNHANSTRFLLAQLHLESLTGKRSPKAVQIALKNLVTGSAAYDHAYKDAMERINGQIGDQKDLARQVLSWITCAKRPLAATELQHALGVEVGESKLDELNLSDIKDIISVCAGLVTIDEESGIIRLVHYTTQEYFERTQSQWFPDAQTSITTTCVSYLSFDEFESGICQNDEEFEQRLQSNTLYDYAAHNWGHHAREAEASCEGVIEFLQKQAHVEASSQALMAVKRWSGHTNYSLEIPKQMTGLHLAAYFGVYEAANILSRHVQSLDMKDSYSRTPLSWAAENGHEAVLKLLLDKGAELETRDTRYSQTPLSWAVQYGREAVVKLLLEKGAELETRDTEYCQTPLSWAVRYGHGAVVELLLEKGAELETRDTRYGQTPLSWAAEKGHEAVVKLLLEKGAELETRDNYGQTPLLWAAEKGHEAVVELLLEKGAELETKSEYGQTPLSWAVRYGQEAVVELLLEKGAELETRDNYGQTPLSWAVRYGHEAVVELLLEKGAELETRDTEYGQTPLLWAIEYRHEAVVKLLLDTGKVDVDAKDDDGSTPLLWAAEQGHEAVVRLLLDNGADISIENRSGWTSLQLAALNSHCVVEQLLVIRGAPEPEDFYGLQQLFLAE